MPQDRSSNRNPDGVVRCRTTFGRATLGIAILGLIAGFPLAAARAADGSNDGPSFWTKFEQNLGLKKKPLADESNITYSERPPLVVPPTRDLPPPSAGPQITPDWPKDSPAPPIRNLHATATQRPSVPSQNGSAAQQRVQNPNVEQKSLFKPSTWFRTEEYAPFTGEPPRDNLTDPPVGYRTPSPDQPYGISPERKTQKTKTAGDGTSVPTGAK